MFAKRTEDLFGTTFQVLKFFVNIWKVIPNKLLSFISICCLFAIWYISYEI